MERYFEHTEEAAASGKAAAPRVRRLPWQWVRITLTAASVLLFVLAALLDERPQLMLVGLTPLALIAGEAVWHLLKDKDSGA